MKKIKFLKRLVLTGVFFSCITFIHACAMDKFPKVKKTHQEIKQDFNRRKTDIWNYFYTDKDKRNIDSEYWFFNDQDKQLTNEEKEEIIESINMIKEIVMKRMKNYVGDNDFNKTFKAYNSFNDLIKNYLYDVKNGKIKVKIKHLNNFLFSFIEIEESSEKKVELRQYDDDGSYLVKTYIYDTILFKESKYDKKGNLLAVRRYK